MMLTGATPRRLAVTFTSSSTVARASARIARAATCSSTNLKSAEGGTSRRSTRPSSTRPGITREACATLTFDSRAIVRRFNSAEVRDRTARIRPWAPGIIARTGSRKSIPAG